jgi:glutathione S-transferase
MCDFKGIDYERVYLLPVLSKASLRLRGFPGITVPAAWIAGSRVQGSVAIARALDELKPDPPLLPSGGEIRRKVLEAEQFGEEQLQHGIRQILLWLLGQDRYPWYSYAENTELPIPPSIIVRIAAPMVSVQRRFNRADDDNVREALGSIGSWLDRIDAYIEDGVIGNGQPNAADFQIGSSLRMALTIEDLRPAVESRPCGRLAAGLIPDYDGHIPAGLPQEWLAAIHADQPSRGAAA